MFAPSFIDEFIINHIKGEKTRNLDSTSDGANVYV